MVLLAGIVTQGRAHPDLLAQIELLGDRLRADPANAQLLLQRGDLHRRHQDYKAATRDLAAARRAAPQEPLLDLYEGRLHLETGDAEKAASLLERYLSREPEHALAWRLHGEALATAGRFQPAAASFGSAIRFSAHPGPELFQWQVMTLLAARRPSSEAFVVIDAGLKRFGLEVTLLGLGVDLALSEGEPEQAEAYFARAPEGLLKLPAWQARLEALKCVQDSAADSRQACRRSARSGLDAQRTAFEQKLRDAPLPRFK
jgi:tetratricopeptide (TPR) repeat protein